MKTRDFLRQWVLTMLLLLPLCATHAQDEARDFAREQQIYEWFVSGRGDSLHAVLCKDFQEKLPAAMLGGLFAQLEMQFGKLQSAEGWETGLVQGFSVCYRDMQFERMKLRFMLAFDAEGKVNSLTVTPAPAPTAALPASGNPEGTEEREVAVCTDGFELPGTLTLPRRKAGVGAKGVPCVVLVHGSGPQDRDETIGPNKPFRDLAWGLAERDMAVLRYEKRTRVYGAAYVPAGREADYDVETVDDALAAIRLAASFPEVAADSIYLLGHSLGGLLAPRVARRSGLLAGIILLAAPARPLADLVPEQMAYLASLPGTPAEAQAQAEALTRQVENLKKLGTPDFDEHIPLPLDLPRSYWQLDLDYNPVQEAARLELPMLVLQGERDYQVTMKDFGLWQSGLHARPNTLFKSYPQLNHLLQAGSGPSTPQEYTRASSVPAFVLADVAAFVHGGWRR